MLLSDIMTKKCYDSFDYRGKLYHKVIWFCDYCDFSTKNLSVAIKHARKHKEELERMKFREKGLRAVEQKREGYIPASYVEEMKG